MNNNQELSSQLLYLIVCAMKEIIPDNHRVETMDLSQLFQLAKFHSVTGICAVALEELWKENPGLCTEEWHGEVEKQLRRSMLLDMECQEIYKLLEEYQIWYMPLKGALINNFYPKYGMRQMSDFDIYYDADRQVQVCSLMEQRGYEKHKDAPTVDKYLKKPIYNFEFHRTLVTKKNAVWFDYYSHPELRLQKDGNSDFRRRFSDEDFYIYMIVHANKHYEGSGTGVRILPDCYAYLKELKDSMNWRYITEECEKLGIVQFEKALRELTEVVFASDDPVLSDEQKEMLSYIMDSGTYGTVQNRFDKSWERLDSTKRTVFKYIWSRIFPDMKTIQTNFPFFYKCRWALPLLWIFRLVRMFLFRRDTALRELKMLKEKTKKIQQ